MAWIEKRRRADGGLSAHVKWRLGGGRAAAKAADDFVFGSNAGYPLHNADFATHVWRKLMAAVEVEESDASDSTTCGTPTSPG